MRIAFMGKGGAGKTTLCALFSQHIKQTGAEVAVVDADINTHLAELLGFDLVPHEKHLSHPEVAASIRSYLQGRNTRIAPQGAFRKTTPPGEGSSLIRLGDKHDPVLEKFSVSDANLRLMTVGTYHPEEVGATCYHNHLAIFENILSHLVDERGYLVADMVAGVDAFASTLHAQFDLLVLVVEPTRRSVQVFDQFSNLARESGCDGAFLAVGNKVRTDGDAAFIKAHIPENKLIGFMGDSAYLREHDHLGGALDIGRLETENRQVLEDIKDALGAKPYEPQTRLKKLWELHRKYVAQPFITERYGDLTGQIDGDFDFGIAERRARQG